MIRLVEEGQYRLVESKRLVRLLFLEKGKVFAWINAKAIGEILVLTGTRHRIDHVLATGTYRVYSVNNEPQLTDLLHLELFIGNGKWQGYLLPTGFPTKKDKRNRIIPTKEIITKTRRTRISSPIRSQDLLCSL